MPSRHPDNMMNARSSYPPHTYPQAAPQYHYPAGGPVIPPTVTRSRSKSDPHRPAPGGRRSTEPATYIVVPPPPPGAGPIYSPVQSPPKYAPIQQSQYHTSSRHAQPSSYVYTSSPHGHRQQGEYSPHSRHGHDGGSSPGYKPAAGAPLQVVQDKGYRSKNSYTSSGQEVKYVYAAGAGPAPPPVVIKPKRTIPVMFWDEKARCYRDGWMEEDDQVRQHQQHQQHHQQGPPQEEEVDWADRPQTPMTYDQLNKRVHAWLDRAEKENAAGIAPTKPVAKGWMDKLKRGAHHSGVAA